MSGNSNPNYQIGAANIVGDFSSLSDRALEYLTNNLVLPNIGLLQRETYHLDQGSAPTKEILTVPVGYTAILSHILFYSPQSLVGEMTLNELQILSETLFDLVGQINLTPEWTKFWQGGDMETDSTVIFKPYYNATLQVYQSWPVVHQTLTAISSGPSINPGIYVETFVFGSLIPDI